MAGGCAWSRRVAARSRTLRVLLRDTQRALRDIADIVQFEPDVESTVHEINDRASLSTALVVLGSSPAARARLLHCLLAAKLLPTPLPRGIRWIRIRYGSSTQVHLSVGNSEFELVEELECNKRPWDTLPVEDLIRQDPTDLTTILEVELNNQFLKDGLQIIIPPDLPEDPGPCTYHQLKKTYADLYNKRSSIFLSFNPVYLYAVDKIGKNVFSENISGSMTSSHGEEDFWKTFNLYQSAQTDEPGSRLAGMGEVTPPAVIGDGESAVFTAENCLDLHQIRELTPTCAVQFVLFADSRAECRAEVVRFAAEATESTEDCYAHELPESDQDLVAGGMRPGSGRRLQEEQMAFMNELLEHWDLMSSPLPKHHVKSQWMILNDEDLLRTVEQKGIASYNTAGSTLSSESSSKGKHGDRRVKHRTALLNSVVKFATDCLQNYLLDFCTKLSVLHVKLVQQLILASFDKARELQVVPKKIQYAAREEQLLYETICQKFSEGEKKQELVKMMQEVLLEMRHDVENMDWSVDDLPTHQDRRFPSSCTFYSPLSPDASLRLGAGWPDDAPSDGEEAASCDSYRYDDYEVIHSNEDSYSVSDDFRRILQNLDRNSTPHIPVANEPDVTSQRSARSDVTCATGASVKKASLDVQQTVLAKLSRKISLKLVKFVDCLKDSYFGTLQRCLESLEASCLPVAQGRGASEAARRLAAAARRVDLTQYASFSVLRTVLDSLRHLLYKLRIVSSPADEACCVLSAAWRRQVAVQAAHSLSPNRLAGLISRQILERLSEAHERYQAALASLETALAGRLHHAEDVKLAIRKKFAPAFARLCLESTSMCDLLMYGTPELGREIGRGQYGVVYLGRGGWAGRAPVAVKSVLPADDRHYRELAMEFFYTRSIPAHPRIVPLYGSVVSRGGGAPCVLLVSRRLSRDLHAAVRAGLARTQRLQIAADIVEGIRYLHSLGLVHRDIKMKNVLLDTAGRAALSDLGFCAAEALMSGSVVGTPVHMAPELLNGEYDATVDVYAFGILFWYLCAGNIKLPSAFEDCLNKEQLWSKVKKGLRPERLPHFSEECWSIMKSCWATEPSQRALLGDVQPALESLLARAEGGEEEEGEGPGADDGVDADSLYMTGGEGL